MILFNYFLMCLIFGTTFLAIKIGIDASIPPFFSAGLRFMAAGLMILAWTARKNKTLHTLLLRKEMLISGFFLTFATFSTLYWAEQFVSSGVAAVLTASGPLMVLLLQHAAWKQKMTAGPVIGCMAGMAGVGMIMLPQLTFSIDGWWLLGALLILVGEFSYSMGAIYSKSVIERYRQVSPIALNAVQMTLGGGMLLILSACTEHVRLESLYSAGAIGSLLYLTVFGSMIGHTLFYWLVAKTNPVFPSTWLYLSPLVALALGVSLYQEAFHWVTGLGAVTILAGNAWVNWRELRTLRVKGEAV